MTRNLVLAGVALLLTVAAVVYFFSASHSDAPTDQFVGFYCPQCQHFFRLSHRDFEKLMDQHAYAADSRGGGLLFKCEKCGQLTAERADQPPTPAPPGQ